MIGLLSNNHSVKTKEKKHQGGEGNGLNPAAILWAVQGIRGLSYTGGYRANGLRKCLPWGNMYALFKLLKTIKIMWSSLSHK